MMERGGLLLAEVQIDQDPCLRVREHPRHTHHLPATLEATQGQILSQSPTDASRFWWHLYGIWLKKLSFCPWVASRAAIDPVRGCCPSGYLGFKGT